MIDWLLACIERRRKRTLALAYNRQFTFPGSNKGSWMCPNCCTIHRAISLNKFSGPQYPACCEFAAGGRLGARFATLT